MTATVADSATRPVSAAPSTPRRRLLGYLCLAALAYIPPLFASPGKVSVDSKNYLYLDPGRLMSRAASLWDPNIGLGTVSHQNIGFLFPMGPYYWVFDRLGVPDWVAQRLWLGSLFFFAAAGMLYLYRTLGQHGPGMVVGAVAYMLTPYALEFTSKFSDLILPWVALPWMIAIVARALRKGGWGYPAAFAIVIQIVGGINLTALLLAGLAPALWIPYAVWIAREVDWRRAVGTTLRIGLLTLLASLWWIAGIVMQGRYGMDILRYTETVKAVSSTSTATETLRGLGYWYFYGGDRLGVWTQASTSFTQRIFVLTTSFAVPLLAMVSAAFVRWSHRVYFIGILLVGMVLAVGVYPYDHPSFAGGAFKRFAEGSTAGLALRSSSRATPLVVLALAVLLGVGVNAAIARLSRPQRSAFAWGVSGVVILVIVVNFAPIWNGQYYTSSLLRGDVPDYWTQAIAALDSEPHDTRILEIPGIDFTNYVWGGTVEPITPGLTDRPYVARELVPWGSPASADLLNAFDNQLQERVLAPESVPSVARLLAAGDILVRDDLQVDRYDIVRPAEISTLLTPTPDGLGAPTSYGPTTPRPHQDHVDERQLGLPADATDGAPVKVYSVNSPDTIVRADAATGQLVVAGSGEGLVDAGARGLLDGNGAVVYSGSYAKDQANLRKLVDADADATLVVTDSNRRR
ncbi:MAG TPA: alpha-(1-_3)-arabinofuranosyltransferase family protein, partial [Acidimicrobiia bacterium]